MWLSEKISAEYLANNHHSLPIKGIFGEVFLFLYDLAHFNTSCWLGGCTTRVSNAGQHRVHCGHQGAGLRHHVVNRAPESLGRQRSGVMRKGMQPLAFDDDDGT